MKIETKFGDWGYVHADDAKGKGHWQLLSEIPEGARVFTVLHSTYGARVVETQEEEADGADFGTITREVIGPWHAVEHATEEGAVAALLRQEHKLQLLRPEDVGPTDGNPTVRQLHRVLSQMMEENPDAEVLISVDVSSGEEDAMRRAFSTNYFHHQENRTLPAPQGQVFEYSLLFDGYVNDDDKEDLS